MDHLFDAEQTVGFACEFSACCNWKKVCIFLWDRVQAGLKGIRDFNTDIGYNRLRLGGIIGIFGMLRIMEFTRRVVKTGGTRPPLKDNREWANAEFDKTMVDVELVLGKEMHRQWWSSSLRESPSVWKVGSDLCRVWHVWMEGIMRDKVEPMEVCTSSLISFPTDTSVTVLQTCMGN